MCRRYGKSVKSTSSLTRHVNTFKVPISLPYCQLSNPDPVLNYNTTNPPDLPSDNDKEGITPEVFNYGDLKGTRPANIGNNKEDIRPANIDKQRSATFNWTPWNGLLSELSSTFREVTFSESEFPVGRPISDTWYEHAESQNNNPFYPFID